ncbi:MAG TPA: hypothetical protein VHI95_04195 [Acidimicrobiales bacterium]|jgi:hypothetical protein|nr:hypothetical protein [Acidimicrobiales bacterium]
MATKGAPAKKRVRPGHSRRGAKRAVPERAAGRRLRVVYDVDGPRVRLGVGWFLLNLFALIGGRWTVALLYAITAAIAALQTAKTWRHLRRRPHRVTAGVGAGAIGMAGAMTTGLVGLAILATVGVALFIGYAERTRNPRLDPILDASYTVRCALFPGFAAACMAICARFEFGAVVGLIFVVAAYETGDYLVGSGASNPFEGPIAGATAIVVTTFAFGALDIEPFAFPRAFFFAALAALLCPAGQLVASAVLPSAAAPASALRRLDSLLLLAPAWAWVVGLLV